MKHYCVEEKLKYVTELHDEIIDYLELVHEYDELDEDEYLMAYQEAEYKIRNGEID
ncbi:hypothetical protein ABHD89_000131 [Salinicoccus halitifaciens]|uniref:Uncharacterized protein n=2 Tax=Salinicoccus halitifaciens TaxID=1073415 RepID=A0ABV2E5Q6_9STAP